MTCGVSFIYRPDMTENSSVYQPVYTVWDLTCAVFEIIAARVATVLLEKLTSLFKILPRALKSVVSAYAALVDEVSALGQRNRNRPGADRSL